LTSRFPRRRWLGDQTSRFKQRFDRSDCRLGLSDAPADFRKAIEHARVLLQAPVSALVGRRDRDMCWPARGPWQAES